jgi:ABC-type uncharacterized transport system permease subunit
MLAWWFQKREGQLRPLDFLVAGLLLIVPVGLIMKQPDLGTAVLIAAAGLIVLFLAGLRWIYIAVVVVGLAMGFAVIPNIFTISEDAIYAVPNQLATGSLALGATPWQTVTRIILLTASPGIFSGIMIGLGRAVGETMIVLMSTGNTPIMDFSLFQGFRALSANIAVEMPESEVNGTHYRVLFLAALVLFLTTFIFNTIAELVRQRLRERYSNL